MQIRLPFSQAEWDNTPTAVKKFVESQISKIQAESAQKKTFIDGLKKRYFPDSSFIGPYEKAGLVFGVLREQWLWHYRYLVKGTVLDMSSPLYVSAYLRELPTVKEWLISDLSAREVTDLGYSSPVDVIGDFCASPPPLSPQSVDTILCISILEHCKYPTTMVQNLANILRPDGVIFFMMPFAYIDGHLHPDYWRFGRDGYLLLAQQAKLEVLAIGDFVDMGKYFLFECGESNEATNWHRGVPVSNWMICRH